MIVCGQTRFNIHRAIVCLQSPVIHAACAPASVNDTAPRASHRKVRYGAILYRACVLAYWRQEATGGVFEIKEWPEELVSRMIDYMYRGDYGEMLPEENEQGEEYEPKAKSTNRPIR